MQKDWHMILVAFDPGKTTGMAVIEDSQPILAGDLKWETPQFQDELKRLEEIQLELVVIENYRIRPPSAQKERAKKFDQYWSDITPAQVIGALKFWAAINGLPVVMQEPSIKPIAYRLINYNQTKSHTPHFIDATAHGVYWFHKHRGLQIEGTTKTGE